MIERFLQSLIQTIDDRIVILFLRRGVADAKLKNYGRMVENLQGLKRALDTQQRALDDVHEQLSQRETEIELLRQEYALLQSKQAAQEQNMTDAWQIEVFRKLEAVYTQLPTLQHAHEQGADIQANDVLELVIPLNELLRDMGFERIGEPGKATEFDPQYQRAVGRGARTVQRGDRVRVRYVGHRRNEHIVVKAQVTALNSET